MCQRLSKVQWGSVVVPDVISCCTRVTLHSNPIFACVRNNCSPPEKKEVTAYSLPPGAIGRVSLRETLVNVLARGPKSLLCSLPRQSTPFAPETAERTRQARFSRPFTLFFLFKLSLPCCKLLNQFLIRSAVTFSLTACRSLKACRDSS